MHAMYGNASNDIPRYTCQFVCGMQSPPFLDILDIAINLMKSLMHNCDLEMVL